jgi:hypothetical protein
MTRNDEGWSTRRQSAFDRMHGPRRLSAAIDARRRIDARQAVGSPVRVDRIGPIDARFGYLTLSHD